MKNTTSPRVFNEAPILLAWYGFKYDLNNRSHHLQVTFYRTNMHIGRSIYSSIFLKNEDKSTRHSFLIWTRNTFLQEQRKPEASKKSNLGWFLNRWTEPTFIFERCIISSIYRGNGVWQAFISLAINTELPNVGLIHEVCKYVTRSFTGGQNLI